MFQHCRSFVFGGSAHSLGSYYSSCHIGTSRCLSCVRSCFAVLGRWRSLCSPRLWTSVSPVCRLLHYTSYLLGRSILVTPKGSRRRPNQALQPTAGRLDNLGMVTSTANAAAK